MYLLDSTSICDNDKILVAKRRTTRFPKLSKPHGCMPECQLVIRRGSHTPAVREAESQGGPRWVKTEPKLSVGTFFASATSSFFPARVTCMPRTTPTARLGLSRFASPLMQKSWVFVCLKNKNVDQKPIEGAPRMRTSLVLLRASGGSLWNLSMPCHAMLRRNSVYLCLGFWGADIARNGNLDVQLALERLPSAYSKRVLWPSCRSRR